MCIILGTTQKWFAQQNGPPLGVGIEVQLSDPPAISPYWLAREITTFARRV